MEESRSLAVLSEKNANHGPTQADLDKCVHCGLCLNSCPTYRELGVEMDSPRGRIYQMNAVRNGAPMTPEYIRHLDLCLACRGCETACPSGVPYGRMIEAARSVIQEGRKRSFLEKWTANLLFNHVLTSRTALQIAGAGLYLYQSLGLQKLVRGSGVLRLSRKLSDLEALTPSAEVPFFFRNIGKTFPAIGQRRYRVAFVAGCIANVSFAKMNEATVRVLQRNGCEVVLPPDQGCCGALHLHSGLSKEAQGLARNNVRAFADDYDAVLTNAAGCGSTLKEYAELLAHDESSSAAHHFSSRVRDVTEFLSSIELNRDLGRLDEVVTYQDSCHLAHGQKITSAPRKLLSAIPGLILREMPFADICCGSAGVYNILENEMAFQILEHKMENIGRTGASVIATANPGCILQLRTGARIFGNGQRVLHVVQVLDEAYSKFGESALAT